MTAAKTVAVSAHLELLRECREYVAEWAKMLYPVQAQIDKRGALLPRIDAALAEAEPSAAPVEGAGEVERCLICGELVRICAAVPVNCPGPRQRRAAAEAA